MVDLGTFRLIRRSSEESTSSGVTLASQGKCLYISGHVQFLHSNLEKRNYQVQIFSSESNSEEIECKFGCHERENLQQSFANEHWTEAETKSDSQIESLMNVAEFKANFMG